MTTSRTPPLWFPAVAGLAQLNQTLQQLVIKINLKEALVAEGLLDKVYKKDELNAELEAKIKSAVLELEAIDKYRV